MAQSGRAPALGAGGRRFKRGTPTKGGMVLKKHVGKNRIILLGEDADK